MLVCEDISDDENILDQLDINQISDFLNSLSNQELGLNPENNSTKDIDAPNEPESNFLEELCA